MAVTAMLQPFMFCVTGSVQALTGGAAAASTSASSTSPGTLIAIVISLTNLVVLLAVAVTCMRRHKRKKREKKAAKMNGQSNGAFKSDGATIHNFNSLGSKFQPGAYSDSDTMSTRSSLSSIS